MRYPQVLVYETDGALAGQVRRAPAADKWAIREPRRPEACLRLLRAGHPSVLVLKLGRDLVRELELLERISWLRPEAATVVVGERDDAALAGLAWDLGAAYVLLPPLPRDLLVPVVTGLLEGRAEQLVRSKEADEGEAG